MPLEAVERMTQATHNYTAEDVLAIMVPKYEGDDSLQQLQKKLFTQALPELLKKWQKEGRTMLHRFLCFCTGHTYLPAGDFEIKIKFEKNTVEGNSISDLRLPESHTCVKTLSIPQTAYNGDVEVFKSKLTQAVASGYNLFNMH